MAREGLQSQPEDQATEVAASAVIAAQPPAEPSEDAQEDHGVESAAVPTHSLPAGATVS